MALLTATEIDARLKALPEWRQSEGALVKRYTFAGFRDAVAFVVRLAFEAEEVDHHPDLLLNDKMVTVSYATHSEGGITQKDFDGAAIAERQARRFAVEAG
jgi:4a-hydroxytetrahydrobiopterin dehydratase